MQKKIMCILSTLIILVSISIVPVSAEETAEPASTTTVNNWTNDMWKEFYGEIDVTTRDFDFIREITDYDYNFISIDTGNKQSNGYYIASYYLKGDKISYELTDTLYSFLASDTEFTCNRRYFNNGSASNDITVGHNNSLYNGYSVNFGMYYSESINLVNNYYVWLVSDLNIYNSFVEAFPNFADQIYYCPDPTKSFLNYVDGKNLDLNPIEPPEGFNKSAIKYGYCFDNPYHNYGIKPYENDFENYLTAGLFSDLNIYYDSYFNFDTGHEHSETIDFYVDMTSSDGNLVEDYHEYFSKHLHDYYVDGEFPEEELSGFINAHFRAVHFERDSYSVLDFFNPGNGDYDYTSFNDFIFLEMIDGKYYLKFTLKSEYTFVGNIFSGIYVNHTCTHIDPETGDKGSNGNGLGSDMSQADDSISRPPTKDELEDFGFKHGYPNTDGSYPYKLTIYRNSVEYFQMYFSKMPSVASTYYSDKCIDYGVNVSNMKVYMYFKEQNMSKQFDFTNNADDLYNSDMVQPGGIYDNFVFKPLDELTSQLLNSLLGVNVSEFNNTYTLHFWTNYTGSFDNMNGFYCKFNWDLENSGHFQKNNSDDNYDYTQDYSPEDSFTDNNGNIHGGAVEPPTEDPAYSGFNNEDFSFDENTLWDYANSFLNFCARAFKVLPNFIWQLIACSMVIVIILRIAGR